MLPGRARSQAPPQGRVSYAHAQSFELLESERSTVVRRAAAPACRQRGNQAYLRLGGKAEVRLRPDGGAP
ncbi:hypothetical protein GUJ93_ZPchr0010g8806 [Zizania palustris]|uniref:Uncharacterized protein n=1 Tax=Zizania palustris TaxID=103762 RepID=A0A8J5WCL6_ZIZPA|nr:hypothetical protein GUJ93_ZPchr0010g8806 [Zizania palustris]